MRIKLEIIGAVQGVGFRPFVYRLAKELDLRGWIINTPEGVKIEVEGENLDVFLKRLQEEKPPLAYIYSISFEYAEEVGYTDFEIKESHSEGKREVFILPDIGTCDECLKEVFDPKDRRYMYPFTNCTHCGPRFTIIEKLPYDRPNTTMKVFKMCQECEREYNDPTNRRFHAQPNACPKCGPQVFLYDKEGSLLGEGEKAIDLAIQAVKEGKIVAVKGIGGFHLICDATNEKAVNTLRIRKRRQEKPFAVMFKSLQQLKEYARPTNLEEALLSSPQRPIVLIEKVQDSLPETIAPGLKRIGAFLPYSPLHYIILSKLDVPIVATSGNYSEEPIVKDNEEALNKLSEIADLILVHNREIKRRCDDSVVKVVGGIPLLIRRSRGYAPLPVKLPYKLKNKVLATGGMLKNTFAIAWDDKVFISQHVGDVENYQTLKSFEEMVFDLMNLYQFEPEIVVCDMHPRYETTKWAQFFSEEKNIPLLKVQHHYAHILSCMAENGIEDEVLGIAWDGTGYGEDGTLWGGEFLVCHYKTYKRVYHFKPFRLIGGEKAIKEPKRVALSLLLELFGEKALDFNLPFDRKELEMLFKVWSKGINSPFSSSVGRLFDAVCSLLGIRHINNYEGQSAMILEDLYNPAVKDHYSYSIEGQIIDWRTTILDILQDKEREKVPSRFINTLAKIALDIARRVGIEKVCLSGGVMQNDPLVSKIKEELTKNGFLVYTHQKVPTNDGGLCLGQVAYVIGLS
ncbi:MAG: carbamoyltransferase HypF [Thermocrinis sp.]|nr:carbamoyltransferase HypF [Thermocrinis sp.]